LAEYGKPSGAWLMLAVGNNRQHGSNDGYDDDPDVHYSWDSTVPNARAVRVGDRIVLWDKTAVVGASVIETIERGNAEKLVYRCPRCGKAHIRPRKQGTPRYRCFECSDDFDQPALQVQQVETFRSQHAASWVDLERRLDGATLRSVCLSPKSQLSMRPLDWDAFAEAVRSMGLERAIVEVDRGRRWVAGGTQGHAEAKVRVRLGQGGFRDRLLLAQGAVCAFTGPAPAAALEAAHLYSYAAVGRHHEDGGLMLRRDLHRLFDQGDIAVDPNTCRIHLRPDLRMYPTYAALHESELEVRLTQGQIWWLSKHWAQHRDLDS
jgi:predicted RNA-binding Zn-ribbon protein involved in translation (DUF1610 family)